MHICERTHCDYSSVGEYRWPERRHIEELLGSITYAQPASSPVLSSVCPAPQAGDRCDYPEYLSHQQQESFCCLLFTLSTSLCWLRVGRKVYRDDRRMTYAALCKRCVGHCI